MESKIFFFVLALMGNSFDKVSSLPYSNEFATTITFSGMTQYSAYGISKLKECYQKIEDSYEDHVKIFLCDLENISSALKKIYDFDINNINHANKAVKILKEIGQKILKHQSDLKIALEKKPEDVVSEIEKIKPSIQTKYEEHTKIIKDFKKRARGEPAKINELMDKYLQPLIKKIKGRISDFGECVQKV